MDQVLGVSTGMLQPCSKTWGEKAGSACRDVAVVCMMVISVPMGTKVPFHLVLVFKFAFTPIQEMETVF